MVLLLDLPNEIFEKIIFEFVSDVGVFRAWLNTDVCKTFSGFILHELFANTPVESFNVDRMSAQVLIKNTETYLSKRVHSRYAMTEPLPCFVNRCADYVLRARPLAEGAMEAIRDKYLQDLIQITLTFDHRLWSLALQHEMLDDHLHRDSNRPTYRAYLMEVDLTPLEMMVAAAAVGERAIVEEHLKNGVKVLDCPLWRSATGVAAGNGKTETLELLLEYVERELSLRNDPPHLRGYIKQYWESKDPILEHILRAISLSISKRQLGSVRLLLEFWNKHYLYDSELYRSWICYAVETGSALTLPGIIAFKRQDGCGKAVEISDYYNACRYGQTEVVRYFLEHGLISDADFGTPFVVHYNPLALAVECGHLGLANFLLESGAHINEGNFLAVSIRSHKCKNKYVTAKYLINHGAEANYKVARAIEWHAEDLVRSGTKWMEGKVSTDSVMAIVVVAKAVKERTPRSDLPPINYRLCLKEALKAQPYQNRTGMTDMYYTNRVLERVGHDLRIPRDMEFLIKDAKEASSWLYDKTLEEECQLQRSIVSSLKMEGNNLFRLLLPRRD